MSLATDGTTFEYDRGAVLPGQWWRLLTGHLTHWSADHLFWDLAVFAVLGWVAERRGRATFLACVVGGAAAISAGLWFARPDVSNYRGLSGVDSALFALVTIRMCAESIDSRNWRLATVAGAALAAFVAKSFWELRSGSALFVDVASAGFESLPLAHVLGAAAGVTAALVGARGARS